MYTMNIVKFENKDVIEVTDSDAEDKSPSFSYDSEFCYKPLKQTGLQICTDDYPGPLNFNFSFDHVDVHKRQWMYSATLNKVFIDMNRVLPVKFQYDDHLKTIENLQIRALPIFATPEFQQLYIKRCPVHVMQDKFNKNKNKIEHIIWSEQGDAIYEEDPNSQRCSVITTIHNILSCSNRKTYNVLYKFMCKSSCSMSLNRRPIYVIFTLETTQGKVLGRKKVGVKVCSCPRRDMLKEEEIEKQKLIGVKSYKKRTITVDNGDVSTKIAKIKNDNDENKIYELPVLPVSGKKLYLSTLELLHGHFLGSAVRDNCLIDSHPLISMIGDLISRVKSESNHNNIGDPENQLTQTNGKIL